MVGVLFEVSLKIIPEVEVLLKKNNLEGAKGYLN